MNPTWTSDCGTVRLYQGDCLHILPTLEEGSVDCVIVDPPYSSGGAFRGDRAQSVHAKYVQSGSSSHDRLLGFSGDSRDGFGYWYTVAMWTAAARVACKPGAVMAMFTDWRQLMATCGALQTGGVVYRGVVPWYKRTARPTQGRWANACEYVVWGTNGPRELDGPPLPGFFQVDPPAGTEREHITQKPVALLELLLPVAFGDRKSTRLNSSHSQQSRMPSSA